MRVQDVHSGNAASTTRALSVGSCELPIQYHAGDWCGLLYRVDMARARFFCDALAVEPWPVLGAAVAGVYAWEYRETSIGPYAEVGIGLLTRRRGDHPSLLRFALDTGAQTEQGFLVLSLPVTTDAACRAGKELWGYPKYVTRINTRFDENGARVRLGTELELELGPVRGVERRLPIATFTDLHGQLLRTAIDVRTTPKFGVPSTASLHLLGGDGPSAEVVQALGLQRLRPMLGFHTRAFRATLPAGDVIGPAHR